MKTLREKQKAEVKAILTEEQWQKLEEMRPKQPRGDKQGRRGGHGAMGSPEGAGE